MFLGTLGASLLGNLGRKTGREYIEQEKVKVKE